MSHFILVCMYVDRYIYIYINITLYIYIIIYIYVSIAKKIPKSVSRSL